MRLSSNLISVNQSLHDEFYMVSSYTLCGGNYMPNNAHYGDLRRFYKLHKEMKFKPKLALSTSCDFRVYKLS